MRSTSENRKVILISQGIKEKSKIQTKRKIPTFQQFSQLNSAAISDVQKEVVSHPVPPGPSERRFPRLINGRGLGSVDHWCGLMT